MVVGVFHHVNLPIKSPNSDLPAVSDAFRFELSV